MTKTFDSSFLMIMFDMFMINFDLDILIWIFLVIMFVVLMKNFDIGDWKKLTAVSSFRPFEQKKIDCNFFDIISVVLIKILIILIVTILLPFGLFWPVVTKKFDSSFLMIIFVVLMKKSVFGIS